MGIRFSFIIPAYNVENYLGRCLGSIIAQDYSEWEAIVIDDGSEDSTWKVMEEYHDLYPNNIIILKKSNEGQYLTRLCGCNISHGEYILFVDADDYVEEHLLSSLVNILVKKDYDMIMWGWRRVDAIGKLIDETFAFDQSRVISRQEIYYNLVSGSLLNSLCIKCVKATIFRMCSFDIECDVRNGEDLLFSIPLFEHSDSFFFIREPFYNYFVNSQSVTHVMQQNDYLVLDQVRPALYRSMQEANFLDDKMIRVFFSFYLCTLYDNIRKICCSDISVQRKIELLYNIRQYELVNKGKKYWISITRIKQKIIVCLFYRGLFRIVVSLFSLTKK